MGLVPVARQTGYENYGDSGGVNRNWVLVGDDRLFFLLSPTPIQLVRAQAVLLWRYRASARRQLRHGAGCRRFWSNSNYGAIQASTTATLAGLVPDFTARLLQRSHPTRKPGAWFWASRP